MGATPSKPKQHGPRPLSAPNLGYPPYKQLGPPMMSFGQGPPNYGQGAVPNYGQGPVIPHGPGMMPYGQGPRVNYPRPVIPNSGPVIPPIPPGFGNNYPRMPQPQISALATQNSQMFREPRAEGDAWEAAARERRKARHAHEGSTRRRKSRKRTVTGTTRISNGPEGQASTVPTTNDLSGGQPHAQFVPPTSTSPTGHPSTRPVIPRAPTPYHRAASVEPSNSQGSSHFSLLNLGTHAGTATATPAPSPSHARRASIQSHHVPPDTASGTSATHSTVSPTQTSPSAPSSSSTRARAPNPLPEPPRDIYESSPYKHLLTPKQLPTITDSNYDNNQSSFIRREIITESKSPKKGLFRAFSRKKSGLQRSRTIEYVYVPTRSNSVPSVSKPPSSMTAIHHAPPEPPSPAPPSTARAPPVPVPESTTTTDSETSPIKPIYFDQDSEYSYYLIHSPHNVWYENREYPTAAHLMEALKFLPDHPEIAERIRVCDDAEEIYRLSREYARLENPNYAPAIVETTQKVISLKFKQHADLRYKLCSTDPAPLRYNDPSDSFWGIGAKGRGMNELGKVLERVRAEIKPMRR